MISLPLEAFGGIQSVVSRDVPAGNLQYDTDYELK